VPNLELVPGKFYPGSRNWNFNQKWAPLIKSDSSQPVH